MNLSLPLNLPSRRPLLTVEAAVTLLDRDPAEVAQAVEHPGSATGRIMKDRIMDTDSRTPQAAGSLQPDGSAYDPSKSLRKEVERFQSTNMFSPLTVTHFYCQAACVLTDLDRCRQENEWLRSEIHDLRRVLKNISRPNAPAHQPGANTPTT